MTSKAGSDGLKPREDLGFQREALHAFAFLEQEFGFRLARAETTLLRYESGTDLFVNVYHGRSSYELVFELGRQLASGEEERFFPADVGHVDSVVETFFQASTAERVKNFLPQLAKLLREHAADALRGDPFAFKRLRDQQVRASKKLRLDWALEDARRGVAQSWREKNYERVVQLFEPLRAHLTPAERKKLDYARNH